MVGRQPEVRGFELQEYIGRGGFSTVYRATQPRLNRVVAVKVIDADIQADEDARRRFERECQTMGSLTGHHAVVTVHEVGECVDGQPYIAMELLEGGSLQDRLAADGVLPWPEVAAIGSQIAEALDAAHGLGILHRDVKPANIMRDRFGHHKLGDFGIAGLAASAHTTAGAAPATVAYAAPEVLLGKRASASSDVYGLGATLFALLTGGPAFAVETDESVVPMVMRITRDPVPELDGAVAPPALRDLLVSMMAKDPNDRPPSARAVAASLRAVEAAHLVAETQARAPLATVASPASAAVTKPDIDGEVTILRVPKPAADDARTVEDVPPPPVPVADSDGSDSGDAPDIARRGRAVGVDLLILGALLTILAAIILPMGQPRPNANVTVTDDTVSVDYGQLRADDFGTTLTVENTSGNTIRVALRSNLDEGEARPPGGATIAAGETRQFGLPRLAAGSYDIVLLTANGETLSTFDAADGEGMLEVIEPSDLSTPAMVATGFVLAALVLTVGWPVIVVPGALAAAVFLSDTTHSWSGANAGFALGALIVALVLEVGIRALRRASIGESVAKLEVTASGGARASIGRLLLRWLAKPLSSIPAFAGYWIPKSQPDQRTWHDRIAGVEFHTESPPS